MYSAPAAKLPVPHYKFKCRHIDILKDQAKGMMLGLHWSSAPTLYMSDQEYFK